MERRLRGLLSVYIRICTKVEGIRRGRGEAVERGRTEITDCTLLVRVSRYVSVTKKKNGVRSSLL